METSRVGVSRERLEEFIAITPFATLVGAHLEDFQTGRVALSVPLRKDLTQHHGFAHGAVVSFMADSAMSWSAASVVGDVVTAEYKINLLAPAVGDRLVARGEVVKASARQAVARADVFAVKDGREKLIATALATIAVF